MVTLTKEEKISRRDLKVVWRCVYPRHYVRNAQVGVDMEWWVSTVTFSQTIRTRVCVWTVAYKNSVFFFLRCTQTLPSSCRRLSSHSLVEFNSSLQLYLTMTLFVNELYTDSYTQIIALEPEDALFFQVALQTNNTFASDVLLQVESCWATESPDPEDAVQAFLLQDGYILEMCLAQEQFQFLCLTASCPTCFSCFEWKWRWVSSSLLQLSRGRHALLALC